MYDNIGGRDILKRPNLILSTLEAILFQVDFKFTQYFPAFMKFYI